jgi:hypothetical protein
MSKRRPLGEMLVELASGTLEGLAVAPDLRVQRMVVTLPVEIGFWQAGDRVELLADLPRAITRTAFDIDPGRLELVWEPTEPL